MKNIKLFIAILTCLWLMTAVSFAQEQTTPTQDEQTTDIQTEPSTDAVSVEPKRDGVVRIGLVMPKTQLGQNASGQEAGEAVKQLLASYLSGPTVETVVIDARTPAQIKIEAEQKGCDFVLYSALSQKQKTGLFGNLIKITIPVLTSSIPANGNDPNSGDTDPNVTQQSAQTVGSLITGRVKAKDIVTLDFTLSAVNQNQPVLKKSLKAKAENDGDDVVSNLIEQAATAITEVVSKK